MEQSRNAYRVLVGKPEGKRPLGRRRHRWEDNIKMDLREVGCDPGESFIQMLKREWECRKQREAAAPIHP